MARQRKSPALSRVTAATERATRAAAERDEAIRLAHESGEGIRAIARAAGLSPTRVHQLVHAKSPRDAETSGGTDKED